MPPKKVQRAATQATQSQQGFCIFTPEDGDIFAYKNKNSDLMLALENREKEICTQREESTWTGRARHTASSQITEQQSQQASIDSSLIDPRILESQAMDTDDE
jgi:hypothetical protein